MQRWRLQKEKATPSPRWKSWKPWITWENIIYKYPLISWQHFSIYLVLGWFHQSKIEIVYSVQLFKHDQHVKICVLSSLRLSQPNSCWHMLALEALAVGGSSIFLHHCWWNQYHQYLYHHGDPITSTCSSGWNARHSWNEMWLSRDQVWITCIHLGQLSYFTHLFGDHFPYLPIRCIHCFKKKIESRPSLEYQKGLPFGLCSPTQTRAWQAGRCQRKAVVSQNNLKRSIPSAE